MSEFRKLIEEIKFEQACGEDIIEEGLGAIARNALLGAGLALGGMQGVDAKTDPEMLRSSAHEITAQYEHGGKGYSAIVKDNYGGYSYGKEQISTRRIGKAPSTFDAFMKYLKGKDVSMYKTLEKAGGWDSAFKGTQTFKNTWLKLANRADFQEIYNDFILDTQILPVYTRMDQATSVDLDKITTWGSQNSAVQAAIRSIIIQHGRSGAFNMIKNVVKKDNPKTMNDFINDLYTYRSKKFPDYKNRYTAEKNDLIAYLNSGKANIETVYGKKPGQSGWQLNQLINKIAQNI